jgi:acyl-[acyl-carrier-protein]-phospholipid O-acyltransferase/long-chain-fatty-acid--[acyl-carrier-protein] ligase
MTNTPGFFHTLLKRCVKTSLKALFRVLFRVRLQGFEHYPDAGERVLIVANHLSYLDPALLWTFLPEEDVTFAISSEIIRQWWARPAPLFARLFPMNPTQPLAIKGLTHYLRQDRKAVIFPEGRITVTGGLMKIYDGAAVIALKSGATVLPVRVDGPQYTRFSHLRGVVRMRWFPPITLTLCPPVRLVVDPAASTHQQRHQAGMQLSDLMCRTLFETGTWNQTLFAALLGARQVHGGRHQTLEDVQKRPLSYNALISQSLALGRCLARHTADDAIVGLLLPNLSVTISLLLGLQVVGKTPALLNPGAGLRHIQSSCRAACIKTIVTARRVVEMAGLGETITRLQAAGHHILYLEELTATLRWADKIRAVRDMYTADSWYPARQPDPHGPAVILFTSGSEGEPKGVVLSHANLLANLQQLAARVGFNARDTVLNVLPVFHSFGLTAGTLLPLLNGMRVFLYPSPLHYRVIPEVAYDIDASILFGTNTFLMGYGRQAHPYDFNRIRLVFAGAEKLQRDTRQLWLDKFGLRILEGYGATETAPIVAVNTPLENRQGTVGRPLPGLRCQLEPVAGIVTGGKLHVSGPNIMLGYLRTDRPGVLQPPASCFGAGWYDTGDVVSIDEEGFLTIQGRVKRFAKIGGEMVSLTVIEELATALWPGYHHAALSFPDPAKGERIVLISDYPQADRTRYLQNAQQQGYSELHTPKHIRVLKALPLLASGKVDYPTLQALLHADA